MTDKPKDQPKVWTPKPPAPPLPFGYTPPQVSTKQLLIQRPVTLTEEEQAELRRSSQEAFRLFRQMGKGKPKP